MTTPGSYVCVGEGCSPAMQEPLELGEAAGFGWSRRPAASPCKTMRSAQRKERCGSTHDLDDLPCLPWGLR